MREAAARVVEERRMGRIGANTMGKRLRPADFKSCDTDKGDCVCVEGSVGGWWAGWAARPMACATCCISPSEVQASFLALPCWRPAGGCDRPCAVAHQLLRAPAVFSLQLSWRSAREEPEAIAAALRALDERVRGWLREWAGVPACLPACLPANQISSLRRMPAPPPGSWT